MSPRSYTTIDQAVKLSITILCFVNCKCPTGAKITGEMFLDLEEDEELLEELNFSLTFKKRVQYMAKEVSYMCSILARQEACSVNT